MSSDRQNLIVAACRHALKPIVRFLLRNGLTFREFSNVGKSVFVEVASTDYGIGGRPTNASRVAILTGLARREVKRQRDLLSAAQVRKEGSENLATRILSGWYQDPEFTDAAGQPLQLPVEGPVPSFKSLLDRYSGDVPPTTILKELKTVGAVAETEDGSLRVLSRTYIPVELDDASIRQWSVALHDLGHTINHNTQTNDSPPPRFERMAINPLVRGDAAEAFRKLVAARGQEFLEHMDDWLSGHESEPDDRESDNTKRLGVGVYLIEDEQESLS